MPGIRTDIDIDHVIRRYMAGTSLLQLERELGVSRVTLDRRLRKLGVPVRSQSEALRLQWARMPADQRTKQVAAAHAAARGRKWSWEELCQRAQMRERKQLGVAPIEPIFAAMLRERGIETLPQHAVGPYTCDLAAHPVAVEIFGGLWHFHGRHLARAPRRIRHFMDQGWHVLMVVIDSPRFPLTAEVADYVATYIETARRHPSRRREYRVVRGAGETLATGRADDDDISIVPTIRNARDPRTGRYYTVRD